MSNLRWILFGTMVGVSIWCVQIYSQQEEKDLKADVEQIKRLIAQLDADTPKKRLEARERLEATERGDRSLAKGACQEGSLSHSKV